jgi:hypothetical protein
MKPGISISGNAGLKVRSDCEITHLRKLRIFAAYHRNRYLKMILLRQLNGWMEL